MRSLSELVAHHLDSISCPGAQGYLPIPTHSPALGSQAHMLGFYVGDEMNSGRWAYALTLYSLSHLSLQ